MKILEKNDLTKRTLANSSSGMIELLLQDRGIKDIDGFLAPTSELLQDPSFLGGDIESIVDYLDNLDPVAIGKVLIVVDSDMDGQCSATIFYQVMKEYYPDIEMEFAIHEGKQHGLEDIIERYFLDDYNLVVLPDAGSNDGKYFKEYPSTQFIIFDHHDLNEGYEITKTCENVLIVNPQLSSYINKDLCGTGVTWQVMRALELQKKSEKPLTKNMIDLVAVATVSDMMSVTSPENRFLIDTGLANIRNIFLKTLVDKQSYCLGEGHLTSQEVAFYIAPLINAMCRVGSMDEKERMILAFSDGSKMVPSNKRGAKGELEKIAVESARECTNARARQKRTQEKMAILIDQEIQTKGLLDNKILIVPMDEKFDGIPSEINGVTAQKVSVKHKRPTLLLRENGEELKGSGRSSDTFDLKGSLGLKDFLESSKYFNFVAGHMNAFGTSIQRENLQKFHDFANSELKDVDFSNDIWEVDYLFDNHTLDLSKDFIYEIDEHEDLWGQGNPTPLFGYVDIPVYEDEIQIMGKTKNTVKIIKNNVGFMFFRLEKSEVNELSSAPLVINLVGKANMNYWGGNVAPQIFVESYEIKPLDLTF